MSEGGKECIREKDRKERIGKSKENEISEVRRSWKLVRVE